MGQPLDRIEDNEEKSSQIVYCKKYSTPAVLVIGSTFLSQHLKNGDPSLERCVASACTKRLKDQQGPHLVEPGSKQPANTARLRGIFLSCLNHYFSLFFLYRSRGFLGGFLVGRSDGTYPVLFD